MGEGRKTKVLNMAHRGGAGLSPENTVYAFTRAVNCFGADVIELDVWSSREGCPVVIHDCTVDRTTNGRGRINRMTLDEIKRLDAAFRFTTDGGATYPLRGRGITIPTLREVFEALPGVRMNIEIQQAAPPIEKAVCDLLVEYGMQDRVVVAAKSTLVQRRFRAVSKESIAVSASISQGLIFSAFSRLGLSSLVRPGVQALQFPERVGLFRVITPKLVRDAHRQKMEVHAWIINDVKTMKSLIRMDVDGIITDYPDRLQRLLENR
ncbi:MAG: glycerophosphodiester phosphodiesterase [Pelotomaculum sp.]|nr:glycerophosphodiester phosphodiesterase [Pelotomaculum sp.]